MEDKLVTLAILTYAKAQILKNVLSQEVMLTHLFALPTRTPAQFIRL